MFVCLETVNCQLSTYFAVSRVVCTSCESRSQSACWWIHVGQGPQTHTFRAQVLSLRCQGQAGKQSNVTRSSMPGSKPQTDVLLKYCAVVSNVNAERSPPRPCQWPECSRLPNVTICLADTGMLARSVTYFNCHAPSCRVINCEITLKPAHEDIHTHCSHP